ncbi:MAG TPA: endonuclease III [Bacillota bacterium]|nr:endonuclease III [Bacillota bacterium]
MGDPRELHLTSPLAYCDSALEVLIATILTQATADKNALIAWRSFKKAFPEPGLALEAPGEFLFNTIQVAGLGVQKMMTIRNVLSLVKEILGEYSIDGLQNNPDMAWEFLNSLPGIGPKTTACTMLFGLGAPSFPIDVHIQRILKRWGWAADKEELATLQQRLAKEIPAELHKDLHILLLNLGRQYCRPGKPSCHKCPLQEICKN